MAKRDRALEYSARIRDEKLRTTECPHRRQPWSETRLNSRERTLSLPSPTGTRKTPLASHRGSMMTSFASTLRTAMICCWRSRATNCELPVRANQCGCARASSRNASRYRAWRKPIAGIPRRYPLAMNRRRISRASGAAEFASFALREHEMT